MPCAIPILTGSISPRHWGKALSFHETASGFSLLSFPFLAAVMLGFMPWRYAFVTLSAIFLIACIVFWLASPDTQPQRSKKIGLHTIISWTDCRYVGFLGGFSGSRPDNRMFKLPCQVVVGFETISRQDCTSFPDFYRSGMTLTICLQR
ncbi:MAG: MFS transporter [Desulfobacteraceae bacterium]|nr:MFS transporter [Desulfobacteraceae bacterium]